MVNGTIKKRIFQNMEEFYANNEARRRSGEADYGVWWRTEHSIYPKYRISYIQKTGEIYILEQKNNDRMDPSDSGFVTILGVVPPDDPEIYKIYYMTLEQILYGWEFEVEKPNGIQWVRDRLAYYQGDLPVVFNRI